MNYLFIVHHKTYDHDNHHSVYIPTAELVTLFVWIFGYSDKTMDQCLL